MMAHIYPPPSLDLPHPMFSLGGGVINAQMHTQVTNGSSVSFLLLLCPPSVLCVVAYHSSLSISQDVLMYRF